jgi:pyruvate/2-oxoglutarate dehydrogenase complex dihydrolipoamide dehydrogenase (E3) component
MPDVDKYEILVLGSGEAGKYLARTKAKEGLALLSWSGDG